MSEHRSKRIKRRGSVLDLVLIFLILLSILGIIMRWYWAKKQSENVEEEPYRMVALVPDVFSQIGDCIKIGDRLYLESGEYCGKLLMVEKRSSEVDLLSNGAYYTGEWDETIRCDVYLELEVVGSRIDRGILWNGKKVFCAGQHVTLFSQYAALNCTVLRIEPINK